MKIFKITLMFCTACCLFQGCATTDPLPSWKDGPAKESILSFVEKTTKPSSRDFVAEEQRIAVFDNDGTLWSEQVLLII